MAVSPSIGNVLDKWQVQTDSATHGVKSVNGAIEHPTHLKSHIAKLFKGLPMITAALVFLPVFLFAGALILLAPVPQLAIHIRWCWWELGLPGKLMLFFGVVGLMGIVMGFLRKRTAWHRAGIVLFVVPVIGVAFQRVATTGEWREISLLGAFLFTVLLTYLTVSVGVYGEETKKVVW